MSKTTVFHVISSFGMGGAEQVALNIASSANEGFDYHIVEVFRGRTAYSRVFIDEMRRRGVSYHRSPLPVVRFHYVFERLAAALFPLWAVFLLIKYRPRVIHTHTEVPDMAVMHLFSLFPRLLKRTLLVRTIHNTRLWTGLERTGRRFERFVQRRGVNVAISQAVLDCYVNIYGGCPVVIPNGVPQVPQQPWPTLVKGRLNVLFAGRMEPQKGITTLIKVVSYLKNNPRYHFHIVGDGSLRHDVEQALARQQNVTLYGAVYGIGARLASFDLLFMPSEFEGLSIMSIEASMEALPVVCNSCAGLIDTLPPAWPLCVRNNSMEEYLRLFGTVIPKADLAAIGSTARQFALHHFSVKLMQERYEKAYLIKN